MLRVESRMGKDQSKVKWEQVVKTDIAIRRINGTLTVDRRARKTDSLAIPCPQVGIQF